MKKAQILLLFILYLAVTSCLEVSHDDLSQTQISHQQISQNQLEHQQAQNNQLSHQEIYTQISHENQQNEGQQQFRVAHEQNQIEDGHETTNRHEWKSNRRFIFKNQCSQKIWVGGYGSPQLSNTGWQMSPKSTFTLNVNSNTKAIRFWPRTSCSQNNGKFVCQTGDCGAPLNNFGIQCKGITGQSPATLAQFTLTGNGGADYYDLSNVDGTSVNMKITPIPNTFKKVNNNALGKFNCGAPKCIFNQAKCPKELKKGNTCLSICAAVNDQAQVKKFPNILGPIANNPDKKALVCCDCVSGGCPDSWSKYCCSPISPLKNSGGKCYVENWPKPSQKFDRYDKVFKNQCPDAYSWQFDDMASTYQCVDADYQITFC